MWRKLGRLNAVTVATNMAGRGTDIILGGNSKELSKVLAKNFILCSLGLLPPVSEEIVAAAELKDKERKPHGLLRTEDSNKSDDRAVDGEQEIDPDVLTLPSSTALSLFLNLWQPQKLSEKAQLS